MVLQVIKIRTVFPEQDLFIVQTIKIIVAINAYWNIGIREVLHQDIFGFLSDKYVVKCKTTVGVINIFSHISSESDSNAHLLPFRLWNAIEAEAATQPLLLIRAGPSIRAQTYGLASRI